LCPGVNKPKVNVLNELWGRFDDEGIKGVRELDDESCEHSIKKWAKTKDNFGRPGKSQQFDEGGLKS